MTIYTVQDTETKKEITFEWSGAKAPTEADMTDVFAQARSGESVAAGPSQGAIPGKPSGSFMGEAASAMQNVGRVYPAAETAATLATSTYGVPLSGLAGIFALPFGLEASRKTVEGVQKALVYQPQTERGKELTADVTYPIQKLDELGAVAGKKIEEAGYPNLAAGVHSGIMGGAVIAAGGKAIIKPTRTSLTSKMNQAIDRGINKAIRPSVVKKEMHSQVVQYRNRARTAVKEIVANKDSLNILDETGAKVEGLPKSLDQFSQAIEQTKRTIFEEYDALAKQTGQTGVKIDLPSVAGELTKVIESKVMKDMAPETIKYAKQRMKVLKKRGSYTTVETQEAIQLLNQSLENFYRNPSPELKGQALIDSMIANNLRKSLDATINKTTGKNYQNLKNKYGALRSVESDVTKRSIVDARKNVKGLLDFSDIYTGFHIVRGVLAKEPTTVMAGVAAKGIKNYFKWRNDPNKIVKGMFGDVERLTMKRGGIR